MKRSTHNIIYLIPLLMIYMTDCTSRHQKQPVLSAAAISQIITEITKMMIHDITNPPLTAQFFSYVCLAGYEIVTQHNPAFKSIHNVLNDYPDLKKTNSIQQYDVLLSAVLTMLQTAQKMQPS